MKRITDFVDDKRQHTNDWFKNSLVPTAKNLQDIAQGWERLLHTSGGQLKLSKCAWSCISWSFTPGGLPIMKYSTTYNIQITSSATKYICMLKQLPITSPLKNLGIDKSPSGNHRKQIDTLINHELRGTIIFSSSNLN